MIPKEYEKYEKTVTLGAINWTGKWGNKEANLEKMKMKVREAAQIGVNMVCFPELALTGYECGEEAVRTHKPCAMHSKEAETIPGPSTKEMAKLAKELDVYIVFGMPEQDNKDKETKYISAAVVGPEGILGSYRKMHLASPPRWTEDYCFKPGNELPLFNTRYGPIGVQICADFWMYPELSRILALKGARIVFNPTGSAVAPGKIEMMKAATTERGQMTQAYIVSCNYVGKERTLSYYGHSTIAGPGTPKFYRTYAEGEDIEEIVWSTVSFETLAYAQRMSPYKERGNWKLIAREYQQIADSL